MRSILLRKRNIFYLNILLAVAIFLSTIILLRDIISFYLERGNIAKTGSTAPSNVRTSPMIRQLSDYAPILENNPFGFPAGQIRPLSGASETSTRHTDVLLIGTVVGPERLSYAIFKDASGLQEVFKLGESVFGIGVLDEVKKEKIVLRKGAQRMEIPFEDVSIKEVKREGAGIRSSSSGFARRVGSGVYIVDQHKLQQMIANPAQMMTDARLRPNIANGKEEGFVLSEVKPGGIYHSLGLQNGDVLLRINEYDISNPEKALQAFTALKGLERVQVDLIRAGSKMTMTYQIK